MASSEKKKSAMKKTTVKKTNKKKAAVKKTPVKKKSAEAKPVENAKTVEGESQDKAVSTTASGVKPDPQEISSQDNVFVLKSTLAINEAALFHKTLVELSDTGNAVVIDASGVEIVDTAIFQLLLAFVTSIKSSGAGITWRNPSEAFIERADILGLTEALDIPKVCA